MSGSAAMLKRPLDLADHGQAVGLADVIGVDRLEAQPRDVGDEGDQPRPHEEIRQQWAEEEAADLGGRLGA